MSSSSNYLKTRLMEFANQKRLKSRLNAQKQSIVQPRPRATLPICSLKPPSKQSQHAQLIQTSVQVLL